MEAVVLADWKGTRLARYTRIIPKPLMPIGHKTILEIMLSQMQRAGIHEIILTVGHLARLMRAFFQDETQYGLYICNSYEDHTLGTAGPLGLVNGLDVTFMVCNGDVLKTNNLQELITFMGIYIFEPSVLKYIHIDRYLDFPDWIKILIAEKKKVVAYPFDGYCEDFGHPDDYEQANVDFEHMHAQFLLEEDKWTGACP